MNKQLLKTAFYEQLKLSKKALQSNEFKTSFYHLENAHVLGQKNIYRHIISHYWMFLFGIKTKNTREIIGQILRIIASVLFTLFWVPKGNTGGVNVSPIKPIIIRKELKKYFSK